MSMDHEYKHEKYFELPVDPTIIQLQGLVLKYPSGASKITMTTLGTRWMTVNMVVKKCLVSCYHFIDIDKYALYFVIVMGQRDKSTLRRIEDLHILFIEMVLRGLRLHIPKSYSELHQHLWHPPVYPSHKTPS